MDIVTDLTGQAVSFLSVVQGMYKEKHLSTLSSGTTRLFVSGKCDFTDSAWESKMDRILEILWCSKKLMNIEESEERKAKSLVLFQAISYKLLNWIYEKGQKNTFDLSDVNEKINLDTAVLFYSPNKWRTLIRAVLYNHPGERVVLSNILRYVPIQIITALGGDPGTPYIQRLLQVPDGESYSMMSDDDLKTSQNWWNDPCNRIAPETDKNPELVGIRRHLAPKLLSDDALLRRTLINSNNPLPFETLFYDELSTIKVGREQRVQDPGNNLSFTSDEMREEPGEDPQERARRMNLFGIALSGGGIRSATFNLGVLQRLAEEGKLPRVDYLSTVSGGGYIGSWFSSWVKRAGSVSKVVDRLDTKKSADPLADEVRPVRWLRMYSNYLSPDKSIMSIDSWTIGITWLRNTLINQVILLILLCAALSSVNFAFECWEALITGESLLQNTAWDYVFKWSALLALPAVIFAGAGMHMHDKEFTPYILFDIGKSRFLFMLLVASAVIPSIVICAWFVTPNHPSVADLSAKWAVLYPAFFTVLIGMLLVAHIGNYQAGEVRYRQERWIVLWILISSITAAVACVLLMGLVWEVLSKIDSKSYQFIFGLPLILEVLTAIVVIRMALMGRNFPDERREWWGRIGAIIHRFCLLWIVITGCSLVLFYEVTSWWERYDLTAVPAIFGVGTWGAAIGLAVKLAYSSSQSKENASKSGWSVKEVFIRFAPYLFMLGFLLIGAALLQLLTNYLRGLTPVLGESEIRLYFGVTVVLILLAGIFSMRVGVNEFSLHLFYRNRLVRAYLGATRRRAERDKSANIFTGFDRNDDLKLSEMLPENDYHGPFPLINTALSATVSEDLDRQDRKAESFVFTPLYCGFDVSPTRSASHSKTRLYDYGYRPTKDYGYKQVGPSLGTAMAISGAAVNPNMGYHSSSPTAFLLTVFNLRLGWWMGNPRLTTWSRSDPKIGIIYTIKELFGQSTINSDYVCLSDGGHFDNMGLYELVRRKCKYIMLGDAEEDKNTTCEGLANAIRRCRIDFGVEINITTSPITDKNKETGFSDKHFAIGTIKYPGDPLPSGKLLYIKTSLTEDEITDVREYRMQNPDFPQQSTGDQFFNEAQFESYRQLGYHSLEGIDFNDFFVIK